MNKFNLEQERNRIRADLLAENICPECGFDLQPFDADEAGIKDEYKAEWNQAGIMKCPKCEEVYEPKLRATITLNHRRDRQP